MPRILNLLVLAIALVSCSPSKKMLKEAKILEDGGLNNDAFGKYEQVYRGWNKAEARVGMKRTAQAIANEKASTARMSCMAGNYEAALAQYEDAIGYISRMSELGIQEGLSLEDQYRECKASYIEQLYSTAETQAMNEQYDEAHVTIRRILSLDRNNQKAQYLEMMCEIMPNYRSGQKAMELGKWREAYYFFKEVSEVDPGFKDVIQLEKECRKKASYSVAYISIKNEDSDEELVSSLSSVIQSRILELNDPFIVLIDRDNTNQILYEQQQSMTASYDEKTALEAGKLIGAQYIVTGELISFSNELSRISASEKKGYLGPSTKDKKVRYVELERRREVQATLRYRLLDAETGQVFVSEIIPFAEVDEVNYAEFEGDHTKVYPGEWKWQLLPAKEDIILTGEKNKLQELFVARRQPGTAMEMNIRMMDNIAKAVAQSLSRFRPEENNNAAEE